MGLLDGLNSLQGPPPPNVPFPNTHGTAINGMAKSTSSSSATSAPGQIYQGANGSGGGGVGGLGAVFPGLVGVGGGGGGNMAMNDSLGQFAAGARGFFTEVGSKLGDTLAPAVDNLSEGAKSSVTSLRRMMGDETVDDDIESGTSGTGTGSGIGSNNTLPPPGTSQSQLQTAQMSLSDEMSSMFNLTMFQRIALFAMCFSTGILLIGLAFTFLPIIVIAPHKFAAAFTMGNLLAIVSTWILVGPRAQLHSMFSPGRAAAASIYFLSLLMTLIAAFFGGKLRYIFVLVALALQIGSLCWYALSYIPYGRQMMSRMVGMITG